MKPLPRTGMFSRSGRKSRSRAGNCNLKGKMQNIIVVKPPNPIFNQAVFFLRDDYFLSSDISRSELLSQAQDAAAGYVYREIPPAEKRPRLGLLLTGLILLTAALLLLFYFI